MDNAAQNTTSTASAAGPAPELPPPGPTPSPASNLGERLGSYRLKRSNTDKMLGGVCGGLARDLGVDAVLLRVVVAALTLITGGAFALLYLLVWFLAPAE